MLDRPASTARGRAKGNRATSLRAKPIETPVLNWKAPAKK